MTTTATVDEFDLIRDAKRPEDVFGLDTDQVHTEYRRLAALVHPDTADDAHKADAGVAFARLSALHDAAVMSIAAGTYGATRVVQAEVRSKKRLYRVYDVTDTTGPTVIYDAGFDDPSGVDTACVLKIAGAPRDNDLVKTEIDALKVLNGLDTPGFFPKMIDSFAYRQPDRTQRTAVVTQPPEGFHPLTDVIAAYPNGVHPKDMAWMWRRVLAAAGIAHRAGLTHNALDVRTIHIHPEQHGVMLTDWTASSKLPDGRTKYVASDEGNYPSRVLDKQPATPGDDIWMAAEAMRQITGPMPVQLTAFLRGCQLFAQPQDAWAVQTEFDDLIGRLWGARKFRPFHL